jgi:hypothetical protein
MTPKIAGGHAISLRVRIPEELVKVARDWVMEKPDVRQLKIKQHGMETPHPAGEGTARFDYWVGHVTLVFVGRDKKPEVGEKMLEAAKLATKYVVVNKYVEAFGWAQFGYKKDHLAATIEGGDEDHLRRLSYFLEGSLIQAQVPLKKDFGFNPHVSMAIGEPNCSLPEKLAIWRSLPVEGLEVKIGSNRTEFLPL